jgi:hypothetical protein
MLHAGLDLSRRKVDVCLLSAEGNSSISSLSRLTSTRLEPLLAGSGRSIVSRSAPLSSR